MTHQPPPYGGYGPPRPPYGPPPPSDDAKAGLFRAGQVAVWVWVVLTILGILVPVVCCALCGFGGVLGTVTGDPTPTP